MIHRDRIAEYVKRAMASRGFAYYSTEHMRLSTMYWTASIFKVLDLAEELNEVRAPILDFVQTCKNGDGGYGMSTGYPSTLMSTFTTLQILYIFKELKYEEEVENYVLGLQTPHGSFSGDVFGEEDMRFGCCAVLSLKLLELAKERDFSEAGLCKRISPGYIRQIGLKGFSKDKVVEHILRCYNFDGGFGSSPRSESHTAQIFCCVGALRALGALASFNVERTIQFLVFRQNNTGGFNGRPDKKEDVCYSFWNLASLAMLDEISVVDDERLKEFIFSCQAATGGFSDRPGHDPDLYHTLFALAGLSLLKYPGTRAVDPGFCL